MEGGGNYIPKGLRMAADRLTTFSRNRFKVMPSGSDTSGPNQFSTFVLPSASLIDLHSFKVHGDVLTTGAVGDNLVTVTGKLPGGGESLINRFTVAANGQQISQGCQEYNSVSRVLKIGSCSRDRDLSTDRLLGFSTIDDTIGVDHVTMVWYEFLGLFSQASVRYLDTSILGSLQVQITWAGNEVLVARGNSDGVGGALNADEEALVAANPIAYSIRNIYATIDSISVDQLYGDLLRKRMSESGYISLLMKEYYTFSMSGINTTSANMRFALSSGSIDKIYAVMRSDNYSARNQDGYQVDGAVLNEALVANYFKYPTFDSQTELDGTLRYQFVINGVAHPQYQASVSDACFDLSYASNIAETNSGHLVNSRTMFNDSFGVFTLLLNLPDEGMQCQTGLDSRSVSSQLELKFTGLNIPAGESANCFVVASCTQEIRIGLGLSVAVAS